MRFWPFLGLVVVGAALVGAVGAVASRSTAAVPPAGSRLLFSDDFARGSLDTAKWTTCYPWWPPDGCTNSGNAELEWYLPGQVSLSGGAVHLTALRQPTRGVGRDGRPATFPYRSGMIATAGHFQFTYGHVRITARVPAGRGLWPALWLLPADQSWPPEIDVMEAYGQDVSHAILTYHRTTTDAPNAVVATGDLSSGWHVYELDWRPAALSWSIDGVRRFSVTRGVPAKPMYLLANLAVDGASRPSPTVAQGSLDIARVDVWQ